jgi:hypothetical protein
LNIIRRTFHKSIEPQTLQQQPAPLVDARYRYAFSSLLTFPDCIGFNYTRLAPLEILFILQVKQRVKGFVFGAQV